MSKKYRKKSQRSRRKTLARFRGRILGIDAASVQLSLPIAEILAGLSDQVEALASEAGLLVIQALLDEEVEQHAGARYRHGDGCGGVRWGREEGYVSYAGRKVPIERPRVRGVDGREIALERYRLFQGGGRLERSVAQRVVRGVTLRDYEGVIDDVCDGYGVRKSSVSRHWKAASAAELGRLLERPLGSMELVAILIDGIEFHDVLLVVALGIDAGGGKHVLGLWPGATENAEVCKGLLEELLRRALATDRRYLFVLDGSKALRKAVVACFGKRASVQRCQVRKQRNVLGYLPEEYHASVRQRLRAAWGMRRYEDARRALEKLVGWLKPLSPSAAASLEEGLEETLTLHRLGVPDALRQTLRSTNPIESCFSRTRQLCGHVKRWRSQEMAQRWAGAMLLEAEKRFRRVKGYREIAALVRALQDTASSEEAA